MTPPRVASARCWLIDGNNVLGSRPDGWWNDRSSAQTRFTQRVAEWCRSHGDEVVVVFDAPVAEATSRLAGGNLTVVEARRRGRNAADDEIARLAHERTSGTTANGGSTIVVTSDRGLRARVPDAVDVRGATDFRDRIGY